MNILFLVSSLLLILSFVSAKTFHTVFSFESEKTSFAGYMKGLRHTRNMWQYKLFSDATKNAPSSTTPVKKREGKKLEPNFLSHRQKRIPSPHSKLNIYDLFTEQTPSPLLYQTTLALIKDLYGDKPFIKKSKIENFEQQLLAEIIKIGKKSTLTSELQDLSPQQEPLKSIYYRMLKGSGDYDIKKKQGYPPLSDFLCLEEKERKAIYFCFASYPVLAALFGTDAAKEILEKEEEKSRKDSVRHILSKQELQDLMLNKNTGKGNFLEMEELLSFSKQSVALEKLSYKDKASGVYFTIPLD